MKKIFITTAIDYTNDVIHIGHAYQKIFADALARYYRLVGKKTFFLTGNDQYGITNLKASINAKRDPYEYVKEISEKDREEFKSLNISYDRYIETTDKDHIETVSDFYTRVFDNGDIYKAPYEGLYCEGCESNKTLSELVDGKCPLHPTREIQKITEENYFFRWSKYSSFLEDLIVTDKLKVSPDFRKNEMLAFIKSGIQDIPISRPISKLSWGIPIPNDKTHVIYVWFDALINYFTEGKKDFWDEDTNIIHILGKDNARWHILLWPAMLKSAGLRLPDNVYVHGFINLEGKKVSKSLGNIIRPTELVGEYGSDAVRYFFLKYGPEKEDVNITREGIKQVYESELANDWGNLVSRVAKMGEGLRYEKQDLKYDREIGELIEGFQIREALEKIHGLISKENIRINENEPWSLDGKEKEIFLLSSIQIIVNTAYLLLPFMPETSNRIIKQFTEGEVVAQKPYFMRK